MKYVCPICGYVYDEDKQGVPFSSLPESWVCPVCKAPKNVFALQQPAEKIVSPAVKAPVHIEEDMKQLSVGELSVLFSNLARGCEKQYRAEEAGLFTRIAEYYAAAAPEVPGGDMEMLSSLLLKDLNEDYAAVESAAAEKGDRGTLRVCVWGQKVSRMLSALLAQYEREGEAFLSGTQVWVCTVCGFIYVGDSAPELCPVCKVPSWKFEKIEGGARA